MGSKKPSKRVVQFLFTSRHTVPTSIPSSNYSPNLRRSCVKLPHILSRMPHSPSGASARPSPHVSIKSLELNALHISQIQDMVHLNGNRSSALDRLSRYEHMLWRQARQIVFTLESLRRRKREPSRSTFPFSFRRREPAPFPKSSAPILRPSHRSDIANDRACSAPGSCSSTSAALLAGS